MSILELRNLSHAYVDGDIRRIVLEDVNCTFERGQFYSILGPSGSGKVSAFSWPVPHPRCQCTAPAVRPADQHIPDSW